MRARAGRGVAIVLLVAAAPAALAGCRARRPPDLILLSLDAVRADAIETTATRPPQMPELATFASGAVRFRRAMTPIPFTLPAHMTLFTGLEPESHAVAPERPLAAGVATLAERLRAAGYRTIGLHTTEWMKGDFGFARGFDRYEQIPHEPTYAPRVVAAALAAAEWERTDRPPVFLFLHFMDAHSDFRQIGDNRLPYYSPPEDRVSVAPFDVERDFCLPDGGCASEFLVAAETGKVELEPRRVELLRELYGAGLKVLDRALGGFFRALEAKGVLDRAVVAIVSDHGEEFHEHGRYLHSQVYDETSRVVCVVRPPGGARPARDVAGPVGLADLAPTLLELAGLARTDDVTSFDGRSLAGALRGERLAPRAYVLRDKLVPTRFALLDGELKLVVDLADPRPELYDLAHDAGELRNLAEERPEDVRRLAHELHRLRSAYRARATGRGATSADQPLTAEERARLRALGYLDVEP